MNLPKDIPSNSFVGKKVLDLESKMKTLLDLIEEPDLKEQITKSVSEQSEIWIFG